MFVRTAPKSMQVLFCDRGLPSGRKWANATPPINTLKKILGNTQEGYLAQEREEGEAEPDEAVGKTRHSAIVWRTPPKKARVDGAEGTRSRPPSASPTPPKSAQPPPVTLCCY